jgi:DNA-binding NtrC family response regulator
MMRNRRVLLISQDRWLLDRLREVLDNAGLETEIALSGAVGANIAIERRVDLLLADEAVDDFKNVRKIKDPASPTYRLPAIVIKANGDAPREEAMKLYPNAIVSRDIEGCDLVAKIERTLRISGKDKARVCA